METGNIPAAVGLCLSAAIEFLLIIPLLGGARGGLTSFLTHPQPPPKRGIIRKSANHT